MIKLPRALGGGPGGRWWRDICAGSGHGTDSVRQIT
jgi:hypothetical protein